MKSILHLFFVFSIFISFPSFSTTSLKTWIDGNNKQWTMIPVSSSYWRGNSKCEGLGFRFPSADDFFEAIDFGLLNTKKNTSFGAETAKIDWIWIATNNLGMSHGTIASRQGDVAVDNTDVRHWILCIREGTQQ